MGVALQLLEVPVRLPAFKPPKIAAVEYEAPDLQPLPPFLDDTVRHITILQVVPGFEDMKDLTALVTSLC